MCGRYSISILYEKKRKWIYQPNEWKSAEKRVHNNIISNLPNWKGFKFLVKNFTRWCVHKRHNVHQMCQLMHGHWMQSNDTLSPAVYRSLSNIHIEKPRNTEKIQIHGMEIEMDFLVSMWVDSEICYSIAAISNLKFWTKFFFIKNESMPKMKWNERKKRERHAHTT